MRTGLEAEVEAALALVRLSVVDDAALERASRALPSEVRSLDAIHLDAAVLLAARGDVDAVLTFDRAIGRRPIELLRSKGYRTRRSGSVALTGEGCADAGSPSPADASLAA